MAAETKWKRPWDDESQGGLDYSRTPLRKASLSSNASGRYTPSEHEHGGISLEERRLPPHSNPNSMAPMPAHILSPSPHRHVGFFAGSDEGLEYHRENPLSYMKGHKRQRIEPSQLAGEASVPAQVGRGAGGSYGLLPRGMSSSYILYTPTQAQSQPLTSCIDLGKRAERHEIREGAMPFKLIAATSGDGDLLRRPSQVSESLYQSSFDDARNAGQRGQCATCSTLRGVVSCIVSGLCRLERELSVLAGKTPDCPIPRVWKLLLILIMLSLI